MPACTNVDEKYVTAAGRLLSGIVILFLLHAAMAAIAFGIAAFVLLLHRERADAHFFANVVSGLYAAVVIWGLHYCRSTEFRMVMPFC